MMKYKGIYMMLFPLFLRKYLKAQYGKKVTKEALKKAPAIYRDMLKKVDDIGADNPMAGNIYMGLVFMAIWKAADGAIDPQSYHIVVRNFMKDPFISRLIGSKNINKTGDMERMKKRFHEMRDWADAHPQYKDKTWDFNFDDTKHQCGCYYYFTRCPIEDFARKNGYLEVLPVCCNMDYLTIEALHGVLHRDYTLATGGEICDYWIVPDEIKEAK